MLTMKIPYSEKFRIIFIAVCCLCHAPAVWAVDENSSSDPSYSEPSSTFEASTDVHYYGTSNAVTLEHKNVSVDDTRLADDVFL